MFSNGLRTMVQEHRSELATVKANLRVLRAALADHIAQEEVICEIFKQVMNIGVAITGALIALLLLIVGYLLVSPMGFP